MTKEQYFNSVQHDQAGLMYQMYKEKFDKDKHKPFLEIREFMTYLQTTGMLQMAFEATCSYYEQKLSINKLFDKNGKLIKFL